MKNFIFLFILLSIRGFAQSDNSISLRFSKPRVSVGILWSDIIPPVNGVFEDVSAFTTIEDEEYEAYKKNAVKRGYYVGVGTDFRISKRLKLEGNIIYQQRKPLEVFAFSKQSYSDNHGELRGNRELTYIYYPTSPQSKDYNPEIDKPFEDFKYFGFEIIPVLEYGGKLKVKVGVGIYTIFLINRKHLKFGKEDFPRYRYLFEPPQTAFGEIHYSKGIEGFVPKIALSLKFGDKMNFGVSGKYYWAKSVLSENLLNDCGWLRSNFRWTTFLTGIDFLYEF